MGPKNGREGTGMLYVVQRLPPGMNDGRRKDRRSTSSKSGAIDSRPTSTRYSTSRPMSTHANVLVDIWPGSPAEDSGSPGSRSRSFRSHSSVFLT